MPEIASGERNRILVDAWEGHVTVEVLPHDYSYPHPIDPDGTHIDLTIDEAFKVITAIKRAIDTASAHRTLQDAVTTAEPPERHEQPWTHDLMELHSVVVALREHLDALQQAHDEHTHHLHNEHHTGTPVRPY